MSRRSHIAVIGGGPAGAFAAAQLAAASCRVTLFDEKPAWEKPCGGALTHKALLRYPFLRENGAPKKVVREAEFGPPRGAPWRFTLRDPIYIYARYELNSLVLERAAGAGCDVVCDRITAVERNGAGWRLRGRSASYAADFVLFATGARNPFRGNYGGRLAPGDVGTTLGYRVPGTQDHMEVKFLENFVGYLWVFPRVDHLSVGICGRPAWEPAAALKQRLHAYVQRRGLSLDGATFYSHLLPALSARTLRNQKVAGEGWAAVGDAAGMVDPITGEGLYYAFRSAELFSACYLEGRPGAYQQRLRADLGFELEMAARIAHRLFLGKFLGAPVATRMVQFARRSPTFRNLMQDLIAGSQGYLDLKERLSKGLLTSLREIAWSRLRSVFAGGRFKAGQQRKKHEAA